MQKISSSEKSIQEFNLLSPSYLRGNTFKAEVVVINYKDEEYGVYAEYGQDHIPFKDCKIIKRN